MSKSYPTDLTDEQWELLSVLIPPENPGCRPRCVDLRAVISAIFYILCAGCAWRMLPHDFPFRANGLLLLPKMAYRWYMGGDEP
jgi:putative transposase